VRVRGRTAIVTGSGSGIGEGIAKRLAREGASVCVTDIFGERVDRVVDEIRTVGGAVIGVRADVSQAEEVTALCQRALDEFGRIDILVNNAGITSTDIDLTETNEEVWDITLAVNLKSQFLCCQGVTAAMKKQQYGRIVNIASRSWLGSSRAVSYAASKGGIVSLTRSLAIELGRHGITVNCVSPAILVPTSFGVSSQRQFAAKIGSHLSPTSTEGRTHDMKEETSKAERRSKLEKRAMALPIPRPAELEDLAYAVLCFAADEAGYLTGQHIFVGGGADLVSIDSPYWAGG